MGASFEAPIFCGVIVWEVGGVLIVYPLCG